MTSSSVNSFVIQEHTTPSDSHWDLMLEIGEFLWSWRLYYEPNYLLNEPLIAEKIHDHPKRFLSYEGPVQNHTATVKIIDSGKYTMVKQSEHEIEFQAFGKILTGEFLLQHTQDRNWLLSKVK